MEIEYWVPLAGFEGKYEVSSFGRVKSLEREWYDNGGYVRCVTEKMLTQTIDDKGYYRVKICNKKFQKNISVHRLVCAAFHQNPENKKTVNHMDGVKTNNAASNLEWATYKENSVHAKEHGLLRSPKGEANGQSKLTNEQVLEIFNSDGAQHEIGKRYGIHQRLVGFIKTGAIWGHLTGKKYIRFRLTNDDFDNIRSEYLSGVSIRLLARKYNRRPKRIREILEPLKDLTSIAFK